MQHGFTVARAEGDGSRVAQWSCTASIKSALPGGPQVGSLLMSFLEPPIAGDETATLLGSLERQRATFAWKCGGLDAAGLRATVGASSMTLGGLLKHLARSRTATSRRSCSDESSVPRGTSWTWTRTPTGSGTWPP